MHRTGVKYLQLRKNIKLRIQTEFGLAFNNIKLFVQTKLQ